MDIGVTGSADGPTSVIVTADIDMRVVAIVAASATALIVGGIFLCRHLRKKRKSKAE